MFFLINEVDPIPNNIKNKCHQRIKIFYLKPIVLTHCSSIAACKMSFLPPLLFKVTKV